MADILSVTSLNLYVKNLLENDKNLFDVAVEGEISNFKKYPSGHCYFTLKDEKSAIKAVLFSSHVRSVTFVPDNGMKVIVRGKISLYERDGAYQLYATNMFLSGAGSYRLAFERTKNKLEKEGLFDQKYKKKLPEIPFKIGVATSTKGAALHDIISVAKRRFPCVEIILSPCLVQGDQAETSIVDAIRALDGREDIDVIIIGRGGGSKEDLWVFNSEKIARAAFACRKPTISAVGHEVDISILDFVCDVRAATPTAAAELALPDINSLNMLLANMDKTLTNSVYNKMERYKTKLKIIENSHGFNTVKNKILLNKARLNQLENDMKRDVDNKISSASHSVRAVTKLLENLSPVNNLKKGYGLIYKDDILVKDCDFTVGETAKIVTLRQELECEIIKTMPRKV
ncbi:MAG: exodeoxyribonuclease VII large subunit [Oscillospiraceae bacterium]|nr:exodeoxyribonuclease VII large subunit [Oscillospiraceae bacterium]